MICAGSDCNNRLTGSYYWYQVGRIKKSYCAECYSSPKCDLCGLPVGKKYWKLNDNRVICRSCKATSITKYEVASDLFNATKRYLREYLNMDFKFPVNFKLVDINEMSKVGRNCAVNPIGLFERIGHKYTIYVLSGLPKSVMIGVFSHELTHQWQAENINLRQSKLLTEGFAEWVQYKLLNLFNQETQMYLMDKRGDTYGQGLQAIKKIEQNVGTTDVFDLIKNMS